MEMSELAYDHFSFSHDDRVVENIALIVDAIESNQIIVTDKVADSKDKFSPDTKIDKDSFIKWSQSHGRFDVIRFLIQQTNEQVSSLTSAELKIRRRDILKRHNELKATGAKAPTKQLAKELEITVGRIRQILQDARAEENLSLQTSVTSQLVSISRNNN
jgi:DNA-directed RNA polymerase sigma subunit (sigma70/sigma32)